MNPFRSKVCQVSLGDLVNLIGTVSQAKVCVLSERNGQKLIPLAIAGLEKESVQYENLTTLIERGLVEGRYEQVLRVGDDGSRHRKPEFTHCIHIPLRQRKGSLTLISLFYDSPADISAAWSQNVIGQVKKFAVYLNSASDIEKDNLKAREIIGQSRAIQAIFDTIDRVAESHASVLIFGETGTGKELVARTIHQHSARKDAGFIPVDCVAVPTNLLESELFGFEKGAFTGAVSDKSGLFEHANQGTLFLDEISELDLNLQAKLLRVLQERQFRRIGGKKLITVDIRIIAAMNRHPTKAVTKGILRRDLYFRLNVIPIYIPPLRQRKDDIPLLVHHFLQRSILKNDLTEKVISQDAMVVLKKYSWPGNIRQLQNIVERLVLLSPGSVIGVPDLPDKIKANGNSSYGALFTLPYNQAKKRHLESFDKKYFKKLFQETDGNIVKAAKLAGVSERTIYRMLARYRKV